MEHITLHLTTDETCEVFDMVAGALVNALADRDKAESRLERKYLDGVVESYSLLYSKLQNKVGHLYGVDGGGF